MEDLVRKLRAEGHDKALVLGVPSELAELVDALCAAGIKADTTPKGAYTFMIVFVRGLDDARSKTTETVRLLSGDGLYWLAYPKVSSKRYTADITRDSSWDVMEPHGMRPVAQIALDDDWSALRFRRQEYSK